MTDFLIGCTHFGHAGIIQLANRPFSSVEEMDAVLIENWNKVVRPQDTVYHLGDFSFKGKRNHEYEKSLNGTIFKIKGNHDPKDWGVPYFDDLRINGSRIVLCHYPIEEWNGWYRRAVHFHAHTHEKEFISAKRRANVGVDALDFRPIRMMDALDRALASDPA